mgnify:CR=1 FL=1
MIELFHIPQHNIDTSKFSHLLHDTVVTEFENNFAEYVGAKYACSANSASSLLYLALRNRGETINVPSTIPIVVPNVIANTRNTIRFYNDVDWVGSCYHLHDNIFDSAQEVTRNQYADLERDDALMIFSFYPTKPVSGCDGGMVVSNDKRQIDNFRILTMNGTEFSTDSWSRKQVAAGYKMHCNSIQAYVANKNLKKLDNKNSILDEIRTVYNAALGYNNTSRHLYRIRVKDNVKFIENMKKVGIQCGIHYEHCHTNPAYKFVRVASSGPMDRSIEESKSTVSLPFHEGLSFSDVHKVIEYATRNLQK